MPFIPDDPRVLYKLIDPDLGNVSVQCNILKHFKCLSSFVGLECCCSYNGPGNMQES